MKKISILFFFCLFARIAFAGFCCGDCQGSCITWCISYETDCTTGEIESFSSIHFHSTHFEFNTEETAPGWVGMSASVLGCDPQLCI